MKRATLVAVLALCVGACVSSSDRGRAESRAGMTGFVLDLIDHHTADDALPVAYERFASLPDPDGDANDLEVYAFLF